DGLLLPGQATFGVCFSPDNSKLYICDNSFSGMNGWLPSYIRQFDISNYNLPAISSTQTVVGIESPINTRNFMALKLYDDTVYVVARERNSLSRINNPNASGAACDFEYYAVPLLPGTNALGGLPTEVVSPSVNYVVTSINDTICYT